EHLLHDTWETLRNSVPEVFQQFFHVGFQGEPGVYDGGLSQEFFTIIARELCAPETEIFRNFEESHLIWFPSKAPVMEDVYFLIGTLFGMALYNMKIAALPFPLALYKKMLNIQPTLK
uniref:HECT domain-containing protein n=1 Tax=Sphenodon punctatus TaxID=8508 RepID=A0A8D0L6I6_SPHPU